MQRWHFISQGQGPDLLLLHGLGGSVFSWRHNLAPLAARFRTTALDLKGHGASCASIAEDFRLEDLVGDVKQFMDAAGIAQAVMAGNSLGGSLAVLLAHHHPDRVRALILLAPALFLRRLPVIVYPLKIPVMGWLLGALSGPWIIPPALRLNYADHRSITAAVVEGYSKPLRSLARRMTLTKLCRQLVVPPPSRVESILADLQVPVAIIWGEQDRILPARQLQRLRECLPRAQVHLLAGVGHNPQEEAPAAVNKIIIAFWGQLAKTDTWAGTPAKQRL